MLKHLDTSRHTNNQPRQCLCILYYYYYNYYRYTQKAKQPSTVCQKHPKIMTVVSETEQQ